MEKAILLLRAYMHIDSDGGIRAYMYRCVHIYTYAHIYLYIYTKLSMCTESRKGRAARTCCVKCRCCSLKRKKSEKNTETPRFFWIVSGGTSVTQINGDEEGTLTVATNGDRTAFDRSRFAFSIVRARTYI